MTNVSHLFEKDCETALPMGSGLNGPCGQGLMEVPTLSPFLFAEYHKKCYLTFVPVIRITGSVQPVFPHLPGAGGAGLEEQLLLSMVSDGRP